MFNNVKYSYRSGTSFARGTTIDAYLSEEDNAVLYRKWDSSWGDPLVFSGGITALTCEMVLSVPVKELNRVYGKSLAKRLIEVSERNTSK